MPFDSREYIVHFWLILPVEKGGGGLLSALAREGVQMLSPFGPFNQSVGGGGGRFGAVQPGGGGFLSPFGPFNQWGGGAYMLTFVIRVPYSPKGGGGTVV